MPCLDASWMDIAQLPCDQHANKKQYGQPDPRRQCTRHLLRRLGAVTPTAHHEKQGEAQAGENGHKSNGCKVCHVSDYLLNARFKFVLITMATLVAVGATAGLGFWQLSRAAQKHARQAAVEAQSTKSPLNSDSLLEAKDPMTLQHQRARLRGNWVPKHLVFLDNRPMNGHVGFFVVMPFVLEGGRGAVAVQRGWVPRGFDDRTRVPQIATPEGVVEIEGRMALPPSNLYSLGEPTVGVIRQNLKLTQFRLETGLQLLPLTLQQTGASTEGLLRDWPVASLGVEKNYGYAAQWFGMATLFSALYLWFQIIRRFMNRPKGLTSDV